jgi:CheY-like chemotaxis protein
MNEAGRTSTNHDAPRPRRVLVVDDMDDLARTLAYLIESLGHVARSTTHAHDVLPMHDEFQPDVAFIDISMPDLSGWDLARQIRAHARGSNLYLVALTGLCEPEDRRQSAECGFNEHWVKPLEVALLAGLLAAECVALAARADPAGG